VQIGKFLVRSSLVSNIGLALVVASVCIPGEAAAPKLAICLERGPDVGIEQAVGIATEMLARAGVTTKWESYHRHCRNQGDKPIMIQVISHVAENDQPGALAAARPFDGVHIRVFYERIQQAVDSKLVTRLLAHVLVHEIAHIIEGTDRHSDFGIMKEHWDAEDYHQMRRSPLAFTEEDMQYIRTGLAARSMKVGVMTKSVEKELKGK
jgi:hypothetical protein